MKIQTTLKTKKEIGQNIWVLTFEGDFSKLDYTAGQFTTIFMHDEQGDFFRNYSILHLTDSTLEICAKILPEGRGSAFFMSLGVGAELAVSQPKGSFGLKTLNAPKLFICTGTGIVPFISMFSQIPAETKVNVLYGVRSELEIVFEDVLKEKGFKYEVFVSQPSPNWKGKTGRVTDGLANLDVCCGIEIYLCGHPVMVKDMETYFLNKGYPKDLIITEHFVSPAIG